MIQGLTEFLPVSSSGHLVILQYFLNMRDAVENITFDIFLHLATLLAVVWIYRKDLGRMIRGLDIGEGDQGIKPIKLTLMLLVSLIATGVVLPFKSSIETQFECISGVRIFILLNALILAILPLLRKGRVGLAAITWVGAIIIGLAQAVAVLPGISRSGATIIAGLLLGFSPKDACRYSFLLSIPAVLIAAIIQIPDAIGAGWNIQPGALIAGFLFAFVSSLVAIPVLVGIVEKGKLWGFAVYCGLLGIALFIFG